ncbi:putative phage tail protein [Cohnella sp. GCM10012308]|uniref:putative phage tail protein n=1 Tax=Cohnella sp. GCM10012308 TaxID=3317329 RepID=UPI0036070E2C
MSEFPITSPAGAEMLEDLPGFYAPILEMRVLLQASGEQFDRLQTDIADQLAQRFISSATWDLDSWEEELGIVSAAGQPADQRRAVIRSKLRGFGKFSGALLKSVAEAYDNGQIEVSFDAPSSTFTVRFVSTLGMPPNINSLMAAIAEIVPAHLLVNYTYRYLSIGEVEALGWLEMNDHPLGDFAPFV